MITYTVARSDRELKQILALQESNLRRNLTSAEILSQGFVTVEHTLDLLTDMNTPYPHVVAKDGDQVVGYTLVMTRAFSEDIPVLKQMFNKINNINFRNILIKEAKYVVMGQVCIHKNYRGRDIFGGLFAEMKNRLSPQFDYLITEIAATNQRSLRAHSKIGFEVVLEYSSDDKKDWVIVLWDWI